MSSSSIVFLVAWTFLICIMTTTSEQDGRELTNYKIEANFNSQEKFPHVLPVILRGPSHTIILNLIKENADFNLPVYMQSKDKKKIILDTPPIKNTAFYVDDRYDASVTLYCEENDPLLSKPDSCRERLMSGYFHLDGYRHMIEPKRRISKRFVIYLPEHLNQEFIQRHQVLKIHDRNNTCDIGGDKPLPDISSLNANSWSSKSKRALTVNIVELLAVITHKMPPNDEEIKKMKLYYTHVIWGVRVLLRRNPMRGMALDVKLIGFVLEPDSTPLYIFKKKHVSELDGDKVLLKLVDFKKKHACDHLTLFSEHHISHSSISRGSGYESSMCTDKSVSVITHSGSFEEVFLLAHEIGHSLGSVHDDKFAKCKNDTGHIMDGNGFDFSTVHHSLNHYRFSSCSLDSMGNYIKHMKKNCLLISNRIAFQSLNVIPTGQLYSVKDQCLTKPLFINVCPIAEQTISFCLALFCRTKLNTCTLILPAYKTTCGNKKWCMYGNCVFDVDAPIADETCLYGDAPDLTVPIKLPNGTLYTPKNCSELIQLQPGFCGLHYNETHKCCATCFKLANPGMTPAKEILPPFTDTTEKNNSVAANLISHLFLITLVVLHLIQQLESYFAS